MRLGRYGKVLHFDRVKLGEGYVDRWTLFELKWLGSVIVNVFNTIAQDRFHTHAFAALSIMLRGEYDEQIVSGSGVKRRTRRGDVVFLQRTLNHRLMRSSPNAMSITICGPWAPTWTETFLSGKTRRLTWGRKPVEESVSQALDSSSRIP